jgi:hypothetical protein
MASQKQIAANRRNALLSCGPKTEMGKKSSSTNALRHGLTARINDPLGSMIESSLHPETAEERRLAQSIAGDHARLNRARSILTSAADPRSVRLLSGYQRRSYRSMQKNLRLFNEMQATRRALEQARLLQTDVPGQNGSGFANDQIAA